MAIMHSLATMLLCMKGCEANMQGPPGQDGKEHESIEELLGNPNKLTRCEES